MKRFSLCAAILAISTLFTLCYTGCGKSGGDNTADVGFSSSVAMQSSTAAEAGGYDEMTATETLSLIHIWTAMPIQQHNVSNNVHPNFVLGAKLAHRAIKNRSITIKGRNKPNRSNV